MHVMQLSLKKIEVDLQHQYTTHIFKVHYEDFSTLFFIMETLNAL